MRPLNFVINSLNSHSRANGNPVPDLPARAPGRLALPIHWGLAMTWRLGRRAGSQWQAGQVCILDRI